MRSTCLSIIVLVSSGCAGRQVARSLRDVQ